MINIIKYWYNAIFSSLIVQHYTKNISVNFYE